MKNHERRLRSGILTLLLCLVACLFCLPGVADDEDLAKDDLRKEAHKVLEKVRVLAYDLPKDSTAKGSGRLVLVRLDRKDQMIIKQGQLFTPEAGIAFTVDKINKDGTVYVSGSGISMARIKKATKKERDAWSIKLREGKFEQ